MIQKRNKLVSKPNYHTTNWFSENILAIEMKPKYTDRIRLCDIDTDSFIMHIKIEDFYKDIADDVERMYDTSNYTVERPLSMGKNKKKIGFMKDKLGRRIMKEFIGLRPKCYLRW